MKREQAFMEQIAGILEVAGIAETRPYFRSGSVGVYVLLLDGRPVYVGGSANVERRVEVHARRHVIDHDDAIIVPLPDILLAAAAETALIKELSPPYLSILDDEAKRRRQEAAGRREKDLQDALSENPPSGVFRITLNGRYTKKQLADIFDVSLDEVVDFVAWICRENPDVSRQLRAGVFEFSDLTLEIREQGEAQ